ncbi:MAG: efflux RND transporter permease subunit [Deltaproteobacteria bacterium]|nr:efflux RND transporter permease subunit [Deltaproteobacteria bacterium]MBW2382949.1 efflux RND transporter permease subunit [Deltaproteobacteria bacterium]
MKRAIAWFAKNHVAANILMLILLVGGLITLPNIKQEVFPSLVLPVLAVSVDYPGASPEEVEESISIRIEEELNGLVGVKRMSSTAAEGRGTVVLELESGENVALRLNDIRTRIDRIDTFPEDSKEPVIQQAEIRFPVLDVAVSGDVDERTLKWLGEKARDEIARLPGISNVELVASRNHEIAIEVSEHALQRHDLSFDDVVAAVQRSSLDLPGGTVKTSGGEIRLRTRGQAYEGIDFERLVVLSRADGSRLTLGDIAEVVDGFEESDRSSRFDGQPAVIVQVFRVGEQSALEISRAVREYLEGARRDLPAGVSFTIAQDDARFLRNRLATLTRNAQSGFVLVLLVLALFLRLRLAAWVTLGIPLSFLGALALLPLMDVSINLISLMGFIVVLGIVVDDAIVVGENTYTEQSRGGEALAGAIRGAQGVAIPVTFGVLTTVAAFAPLLFVPGPMGLVARVIPAVVIACLLLSLFESLFILPAHLGNGSGGPNDMPRNRLSARWRRLQDHIGAWLEEFITQRYRPFLDTALEWRYMTAAVGLTILIVTSGLLLGGWLRFVFQPDVEGDVMVAYVTMPAGTPAESTALAVTQIERAAYEMRAELDAERNLESEGSIFAHALTSIGTQPYRLKQASGPAAFAAAYRKAGNLGEVQIEVVASERRSITVAELTRRWRERTGQIPGAEELSFSSSIMSAGSPMSIELKGESLTELRRAANTLKRELATYPGVIDISDSFRGGKQELTLEILPEAEALGLSLADLGRQVRQAFYGHEAQRVQRGKDDVRVVVRYPRSDRHSLGDLEQMHIRTADGFAVPFSAVARAEIAEGYATIKRIDRRRVVTVTADVDEELANANEIVADLRARVIPDLVAAHPLIEYDFAGEQREQAEFLDSLKRGWIVALLVIYALLAIPLRSYTQPFVIMTAIPFGLVGAVWGHVLMGHDFSMFSLIGLVALSGVVVNDSLVMVDYINGRRDAGEPIDQAIRTAGVARFRAILLTSLTTFAGLTPLMLETGVQAQMLIPMAISLAFGVIFATTITLVMVPTSYLILDDLHTWLMGAGRSASEAARASAAPTADVQTSGASRYP